jgi:hypothetical protein
MSGPGDSLAMAKVEIKKALGEYFLGYDYPDGRTDQEHLDEAASKVLNSIGRFIAVHNQTGKKLGATVMTHTASMRSGKDGLPGIAPKNL